MTTGIEKVAGLPPDIHQVGHESKPAPSIVFEEESEGYRTDIEGVASIDSVNSTATGILAAGTAEQKSDGFESYTMTLGRWTWDAVKPDRANLTKWYNLSTARRVLAGIVAVVSLPFAVIADAFRGIAYNLPKSWKLHNSGTAPLKKMAAPLCRQLLPSRDAFKASARRLAEAYDCAGAAYEAGNRHSKQPNKIIHDQINKEFEFLTSLFVGLSAEASLEALQQIEGEMEKYTKSRPDLYLTSENLIKKTNHAIWLLEKKLQPVFAQTIAAQVVDDDGTVREQKQTQLTKQFETNGLIPSSEEFQTTVNGAVKQHVKTVVQMTEEKKAAEDQKRIAQQAAADAARKNAEIAQEAATRAKQTQQVAEIASQCDIVSGCLEVMIEIQTELSSLYDQLKEDLTVREGLVADFRKSLTAACKTLNANLENFLLALVAAKDGAGRDRVFMDTFGSAASPLVTTLNLIKDETKATHLEMEIDAKQKQYEFLNSEFEGALKVIQANKEIVAANPELVEKKKLFEGSLPALNELKKVVDAKFEETYGRDGTNGHVQKARANIAQLRANVEEGESQLHKTAAKPSPAPQPPRVVHAPASLLVDSADEGDSVGQVYVSPDILDFDDDEGDFAIERAIPPTTQEKTGFFSRVNFPWKQNRVAEPTAVSA